MILRKLTGEIGGEGKKGEVNLWYTDPSPGVIQVIMR